MVISIALSVFAPTRSDSVTISAIASSTGQGAVVRAWLKRISAESSFQVERSRSSASRRAWIFSRSSLARAASTSARLTRHDVPIVLPSSTSACGADVGALSQPAAIKAAASSMVRKPGNFTRFSSVAAAQGYLIFFRHKKRSPQAPFAHQVGD
ncbi:hypothetical protein BN136_1261 [Cronobacter universalis NCTC 9529]|nr:hypothetical protein BN136_1261 [Cronobacter universalis NCTC 9529]